MDTKNTKTSMQPEWKPIQIIATDYNQFPEEQDQYFFKVKKDILEKQPFIDTAKEITSQYVSTPDGQHTITLSYGYFNWGDFAQIPDSFLEQRGVRYMENPFAETLCVNASECLYKQP